MKMIKVCQVEHLDEIKKKKDLSIKPSKLSGLLFGIHKEILDEKDGKDIVEYICFTDDSFIYCDINNNIFLNIDYKFLDNISFSMSGRVAFRRIGFSYTYQIDIIIKYKNNDYWFEVYNPKYMLKTFEILKMNNVNYQDKCNIEEIYKKHPNEYDRLKFLEAHYKEIAEKYNLDNPRKC